MCMTRLVCCHTDCSHTTHTPQTTPHTPQTGPTATTPQPSHIKTPNPLFISQSIPILPSPIHSLITNYVPLKRTANFSCMPTTGIQIIILILDDGIQPSSRLPTSTNVGDLFTERTNDRFSTTTTYKPVSATYYQTAKG